MLRNIEEIILLEIYFHVIDINELGDSTFLLTCRKKQTNNIEREM